jgi:Asp-tRNA(Asn)/Glu-tRNA(Gln) amidotransferase A subunit family amidase
MEQTAEAFADYDVIVTPPYAANSLALTNLTGHPAVVAPNGFSERGLPSCIVFLGKLWGEAEALRVAHAFQDATEHHRRVPEAFRK